MKRPQIFSTVERARFMDDTVKLRELAEDYDDAPREIVLACAGEIDRLRRLLTEIADRANRGGGLPF